MKRYKYIAPLIFAVAGSFTACKNEPIPNPNAPTQEEITKNPTIGELNNLVTGAEGGMRRQLALYTDMFGVFGREFHRYSSSDNRWTDDMLGKGASLLDNTAFYVFNSWMARYTVVKNCNLIIAGADKTTYTTNAKVKKGYKAFAQTIMAYQLLLNLNQSFDGGIRLDVADPFKLGPIVKYPEALAAITKMLDDANTDLADSQFSFPLSAGFEGYNTPATFAKFNRAIAARVALYQGNWADALTKLQGSFIDRSAAADLYAGPKHIFAEATGDVINEVYVPANGEDEAKAVHPSFIAAIDPADDRMAKIPLRTTPFAQDGLTSPRDLLIYTSLTSPISIIRNEELILIYAEAQAQNNNLPEAADALNYIRTRHGIAARTDLDTKDKLIDEMLKQRWFSLIGEGHRWIDMRRYNRLQTLPKDRANDDVWEKVPLPLQETNY